MVTASIRISENIIGRNVAGGPHRLAILRAIAVSHVADTNHWLVM